MGIYKNGIWEQNEFNERMLPDGYTQLEYIEGTGTQYININFAAKSNCIINTKINFTEFNTATSWIMGCNDNTETNRFYLPYVSNSTGSPKWSVGYATSTATTNFISSINTDYILYSELKSRKAIFYY